MRYSTKIQNTYAGAATKTAFHVDEILGLNASNNSVLVGYFSSNSANRFAPSIGLSEVKARLKLLT